MGFPVVWTLAAITKWVPVAKAAVKSVLLPSSASKWDLIRSAMAARMKALYEVLPGPVRGVVGTILVSAGISGVTETIQAWHVAGDNDEAFAVVLMNLAAQGINPELVAPPEYLKHVKKPEIVNAFAHAKEAYAHYLSIHGTESTAAPFTTTESRSGSDEVALIRAVAALFGVSSIDRLLEVKAQLSAFSLMSSEAVAEAGLVISAAGGRL